MLSETKEVLDPIMVMNEMANHVPGFNMEVQQVLSSLFNILSVKELFSFKMYCDGGKLISGLRPIIGCERGTMSPNGLHKSRILEMLCTEPKSPSDSHCF